MRKLLCDHLCDCHRGISGADDDELFGEVLAHLSRDHPSMPFLRSAYGSSSLGLTTSSMRRCTRMARVLTKSSVLNLTEPLRFSR